MRTVHITSLGEPPTPSEREAPGTDAPLVLRTLAVALNPVDVAIGAGRFYAGHPPLPYVPGIEAVGRIGDRLVYAQGSGRGIGRDGFVADLVAVDEGDVIDLPTAIDPALAVALGTAGVAGWLSTTDRAAVGPDDRVVVLGASGAVGTIAIQAARHSGAAAVVAVGRDRSRLERLSGADAVVPLGEDLAERVVDASGGPPTVVIDMLWGEPLAALLPAVAPGARVVNVGASAGPDSSIPSAAVRGKQLSLLGYSNFALARSRFADGYRQLVELAASGSISLPVVEFGIEDAAEAWRAAATGDAKAVIVMEASGG